jgi:predicted GIY-YIG superfamily endonuclease
MRPRRRTTYSVYATKSIPTGRIYVGQTKNRKKRLRHHNEGLVRSTAEENPWELCAAKAAESGNEAMHVEWKKNRSKGARLRWLKENAITNKDL